MWFHIWLEKAFHIFVFLIRCAWLETWAGTRSVGLRGYFSRYLSHMPSSASSRGSGTRCIQLLSCWTGCLAGIIPCLAAKPIVHPNIAPTPIINVDSSMPSRRSFTTDEQYNDALLKWKRDSVNILTSHMHTAITNGTWTADMMQQLNSEIDRINFFCKFCNIFENLAR